MRVAILGAGYVGLVSGACFADFGHHVVCVDKDPGRIARLRQGEMPIFEPGLADLVARNVAQGRLAFRDDVGSSVDVDVLMIAVGTPSRRGDGHADLSYVHAAAQEVAPLLSGFTVIVNKSTVPVGTGDEVEAIVRKANPAADFEVVSNPEFLREGAAIEDFKHPDRIVVGTDSERARLLMRELYRPLFLNETPILFTGRRTAEIIKYATNAFLATKISFINEIADLCERTGGKIGDVARGIGLDKRIGPKFLHPGPGFGGSCFPKDTLALVRTAREAGSRLRIVETVVEVNERRKSAMAERIVSAFGGSLEGRTIGVLGLTFKPNTDDMREAPALTILPLLQKAGAAIRAFDPQGVPEAEKHFRGVVYCTDPYEVAAGADAVVVLTEWDQFRGLDDQRLKAQMRGPFLFDFRNIFTAKPGIRQRFVYHNLGEAQPQG